ncbi:glycerophosphocholine acyltransferase 1 [Monosporozyma unispora]|nr:hypothetical protein C6P44_002028 [Kazachstania unispora]
MSEDINDKDEGRVSLGNILELLDPIASKVLTKQYQSNRNNDNNNFTHIDIKPYHSSKTSHLKHRTHANYKQLRQKLSVEELKSLLSKRLKALDRPLQSIFFKNTNKLEKLFYPFTLCNIFFIGFIMGRFPEWFHIYYTVLLFLLMPIRFYTYYKQQNHYFMADLCYFVNFLCLMFIWFGSNSRNLFQSCFALTFGSLSFAVITWRNSLVLHSIDKTTSCFIHIIPPVTMYVIYYGLSEEYKMERFPGALHTTLNLRTNIIWTSFYYLLWQTLYHYFITLKRSQKIKSGQRMTSFEYLTKHKFKNFWAVKLNSPWPMIIYTLAQYFYQLFTMLLCSIWIRYKWAASLFLCYISWRAAYNGATYYVDVYGKNFEHEVHKLKQELDFLQKRINEQNNNSSEESLSPISTNEAVLSD